MDARTGIQTGLGRKELAKEPLREAGREKGGDREREVREHGDSKKEAGREQGGSREGE